MAQGIHGEPSGPPETSLRKIAKPVTPSAASQAHSFKILCPEPENYSQRGLSFADEYAQLDAVELSQAEFERRAPFYEGLMVRLRTRVTGSLIAGCPNLRAIITPTTGLDHIDLEAASVRNIRVFSLRGEAQFLATITSTAEHTWASLLCLVRRIVPAQNAVKQDQWHQHEFRSWQLSGRTLGVLGLGRLGTMVARYGVAFGMHVHAYDPYIETCPDGVTKIAELDEVLSRSNVVTVHVPLKDDTIGLIGIRELGLLPRGSYLINSSRGLIVDEEALLVALESGQLAGAAVDVLTNEDTVAGGKHPMVEYARTHENLLITPHIGGASQDAIDKTDVFVLKRFEHWLTKVELPNEF